MDSTTDRRVLPQDEAADLGAEFEPFLQEWRPAPEPGTVVLTSRHLAIIGFVGMVALALMATLAYVAGRIASNGPSRIVMVDTAQALPVQAQPVQTVAPAPPAAKPVRLSTTAVNAPIKGEAFWQVGALDRGMATVSLKYLQENGLPARLEPVAGSALVRVLVGPAAGAEIAALKQKLDGLGFPAFIKQY